MIIKDITLLAILTAVLVVSQLAFSMVMGINLVFPLFIIYTYNLGLKRTLLIMIAFIIIEFFIWGYLITAALYLWTFTILVIGAYLVSRITKNEYVAGAYTFVYFMLFGLLAAIQEWILTDVGFYVYWLRGLPSDTLGAVGGFGTLVFLLAPLTYVIQNYLDTRTKGLTEK